MTPPSSNNATGNSGSQNEVLSETTPQGDYKVTYGRTDAQGQPVIEQYTKDALTAYVEHDPVTGEPLMLRTASGKQALYVHDGTGNPAALITNEPYVAFTYDYPPSPKSPAATPSPKTPTPSKTASKTAPPAGSNTVPAGTTPPPAAGPNETPKTHPWTQPTPTATPTPPPTPSTTRTQPDMFVTRRVV